MDNLTHWESIFIYRIKFSSHRIGRSKGRWFLNTDRHCAWTFRQVRPSSTSACKREQIPSSSSVPFSCPPIPREVCLHPPSWLPPPTRNLQQIPPGTLGSVVLPWVTLENMDQKKKKQKKPALFETKSNGIKIRKSHFEILSKSILCFGRTFPPPRRHKRGEVLSAEDCVFYKWWW